MPIPAVTPASLGYRMPAEWEPHAATWLSWPHDPVTFPDCLPEAQDAYRDILRALTPHERVNLLVKDEETHHEVAAWLREERLRNVTIWDVPPRDVWFRDYGPIFVKKDAGPGDGPSLAMTNWRFNAWGDKYPELLADNEIPGKLQPHLGLPMFTADIVMEGGSLDVNGAGTLLTTEQCLLNKNRNPHHSREDIEAYLGAFLGVRKVLWLGDGIEADDTDGHVDDLTRFVNPTTVVTIVEADESDTNFAPLKENLERLRGMTTADGEPITIVELPTPGWFGDDEGRLPASYANFYVANGVVLVPQFGHANDQKALGVLAKCFPDRRAVGIDCSKLVYGMGTLHCITQQQPAAR